MRFDYRRKEGNVMMEVEIRIMCSEDGKGHELRNARNAALEDEKKKKSSRKWIFSRAPREIVVLPYWEGTLI